MSVGIGEVLREARETQGRSQQDAAQSLRVRTDYVEALETEQFGIFGADTYARGHLRNYAVLLGLDPQELLHRYDRYVRTDDQTAHHIADAPVAMTTRDPLPGWIKVIGGAVLVLGAFALVGLLGDNAPPPADPGVAITDSATSTDGASDDPAAPVEPTATPEPSPTPTFEGVQMLLIVETDCWMEIRADGELFESPRTVPAGETVEVQADEIITVTFGNAGGVLVEVNGQRYGRPGGNGEVVRNAEYGPNGPVDGQET